MGMQFLLNNRTDYDFEGTAGKGPSEIGGTSYFCVRSGPSLLGVRL